MRRAALVIALVIFAAPFAGTLGAQQLVPVPWPVAEGGLLYEVTVDGSVSSQHSTIHGALREAGLQAVACETCAVAVEHTQRWRVDLRWVTTEGEPEPDPDPIDPEPDPIAEWSADSTTVYPSEEEEYQPASLAWMDGTPHLCVTDIESGSVGWIEVELQEVDLEPYWVVTYPGAAWWPGECADSQANIAGEPSQWVALYPVVAEEEPADPVDPATLPYPGTPTFAAHPEGGASITWGLSEGAEEYRVEYLGGSLLVAAPPAHLPDLSVGSWACVYPRSMGEDGPLYRCNTWRDG